MSTIKRLLGAWGPGEGSDPSFYPQYGRRDLAKLTTALGFTSGAEVGVSAGLFSKQICARNPAMHLLCVDNWAAYPAVPPDSSGQTQEEMDAIYERARARLEPFNTTLLRQSSVEAASQVEDASLDFVYVDASHLLPDVIADIAAWAPKVRRGGIVAGHDFTHTRFYPEWPMTREAMDSGPAYKPCHVIEAVRAWTRCYSISPWFVLDGVKSTASWMWVVA